MSNDGFMDFTFGSGDDNVEKKSKRFKGKEGETYRVSFVWLTKNDDGEEVVRFTGCERHYVQGVGYFLHKGPEYAALAGGPAKQAVASVIVVWPTDRAGRLNKEAFAKGEGFEVMPWVFSGERYTQLKLRNEQFPLAEFDLIMACSDSQYQKMDLSPCRESLFLKLAKSGNERGEAIAKSILDEVELIVKGIRNEMARDLSLDQIREKMTGTAPSTPVSSGAVENVDGLLDNLLDD